MSKLKGFKAMKDFPGTRAGDIYEPSSYDNFHYWKKVGSYDDTLALEEIFAFSEYFQAIFYSENEINSLFNKSDKKETVNDFCNDIYEDEEFETNDSLQNKKESIFDKKIFVIHVGIGNMDSKDVSQYLKKIKSDLSFDKYSDLVAFFIPIRGEVNSRIEILQ